MGGVGPARTGNGRPCSSRTPPCASETRTDSAGRRVHFPSCREEFPGSHQSLARHARQEMDGIQRRTSRGPGSVCQRPVRTEGTGQAGRRTAGGWREASWTRSAVDRSPSPVERCGRAGWRGTVQRSRSCSLHFSVGRQDLDFHRLVAGTGRLGSVRGDLCRNRCCRGLACPQAPAAATGRARASGLSRGRGLASRRLARWRLASGGLSSRRLPRCSLSGGLLGGLLRRALPCRLARGALARSCLLCAAAFRADLPLDFRAFATS